MAVVTKIYDKTLNNMAAAGFNWTRLTPPLGLSAPRPTATPSLVGQSVREPYPLQPSPLNCSRSPGPLVVVRLVRLLGPPRARASRLWPPNSM